MLAEARARALALADRMTDEVDAARTAAALGDPDNPPLTDDLLARRRPASPATVARIRAKARAGAKERVTLDVPTDVLDHFRQQGEGWQQQINEVLRKAVAASRR